MPDAVDLEISIMPVSGQEYQQETRLNNPYAAQMDDPVLAPFRVAFQDLENCRMEGNWVAYGGALSAAVFGDPGTRRLYDAAVREAAARRAAVRLRLIIDQGAPGLHRLVWESMLDPLRTEQNAPVWLSTRNDLYFSRCITGGQVRQTSLRQKFQIRALVFIASPPVPAGYMVPPIDVEAERQRALAGLGKFIVTVVASSPQNPGEATMARLLEHLDKGYDILYLVCHGRFENSQDPPDTWLYLEDSQGRLDRVRGKQLVTEMQRLATPPNLVLLMSCQTAGNGEGTRGGEGVLAALGPRLTRAGVPAVVAMQANLRMDTAATFFPALLENLQKSGIIDAAVREARGSVSRQPDFYVPVLFHRLKSGRIWYGESDSLQEEESISWQALATHIEEGEATVILGSGLLEPYIGSQAEIARRLSDRFGYPFSEKDRDDIALVSQYISAVRAPRILQTAYLRELALQVLRQYGDAMPELMQGRTLEEWGGTETHVENMAGDLLHKVWMWRCKTDPLEPHTVLAKLPFKAYITTNADQLMEAALSSRNPIVWECGKKGSNVILEPGTPSPQRPLLAYLYGNIRKRETLVLTEDDYFQHLTTAAAATASSVRELNSIFVGSALIFLGFRLHEWDFRIFFRRLKWMESWYQHTAFAHVAVQLDPSSSGGHASSRDVRKFLQNFIESNRIEVFEGSVEQFVRGLSRHVR